MCEECSQEVIKRNEKVESDWLSKGEVRYSIISLEGYLFFFLLKTYLSHFYNHTNLNSSIE